MEPKHGAERNRREEQEIAHKDFVDANEREPFRVYYVGHTHTVVEHYCGVCGEWKTCGSIVSWMCCPTCGTEWDADLGARQ